MNSMLFEQTNRIIEAILLLLSEAVPPKLELVGHNEI